MKKIMFNDKYGLTEAVLEGKKTMTRRIIRNLSNFDPRQDWMVSGVDDKGKSNIAIFHIETYKYSIYPQYQLDEVVAVAQSYSQIHSEYEIRSPDAHNIRRLYSDTAGWNNKLFVKADSMPHQIQITNIKMERLQDISEEDCLREGITEFKFSNGTIRYTFAGNHGKMYDTPTAAFSALIDKVSGKGTWERNPRVFAYEFKLVK